MEPLTNLFARNGYLPHGVCFSWSPGLLWSMVLADALIALAYFSIPLAILRFMRARGPMPQRGLAWLFAGFILACGLTHVMGVWTVWRPDYAAELALKLVTAALSVATAVALWPLVPRLLALPTVAQLQAVVASLGAEMRNRLSAEQHLAELEQTLSVTLNRIGAGFISTDAAGHVVAMNDVAEQVTGSTLAQARGQPLWQLLPMPAALAAAPQAAQADLAAQAALLHDRQPLALQHPSHGDRLIELQAALRHDQAGRVCGLTLVFRDMTRLSQAEAELRRMAAVVESSHDAIVTKSLDGTITGWNAGAQRLFGYRADEILGQPVQQLIPPECQADEMRILAELAEGHELPSFDTVRLARDGRRLQVSVQISPVRDLLGRVVGGSKIARDVSAQRAAEAALRDREARLRLALEMAGAAEWELDLATGQTRRSPRHDAIFGHPAPLPQWTLATLLAQVHADDRAAVADSFHHAVSTGGDWHMDCRIWWPDGSLHWVSLHAGGRRAEPLAAPGPGAAAASGPATHLLGLVADVTLQRQAEESRHKAAALETENRQIQQASRMKSQFLATMSHELRTPLNAIIGFSDLLHAGAVPATSPAHREFLGHIGTSGRHLLQLINDVLDLSKVEAGRFEFQPEPVQLPQLVQEVRQVLHTQIQRKRLVLEVDIAPGLDDLVLDPARLKQALYNYLSNAIKFTAEGGQVSVLARPEGEDGLRIEVADTGIGIAADDLPRLFQEFQQLDGGLDRRHEGTGLGLALTRRLVQAQGGSVGVRSVAGLGSVFHLVLPRRPRSVAPPAPPGPGHRVLVVEADGSLRRDVVNALQAGGIAADSAASSLEARQRARGQHYDALTLGLQLPDDQGLGALAHLRREARNAQAPVLGMTLPAPDGRAAGFAVANVLAKPMRTGEVVAAIARLQLPAQRRARLMVVDDDPLALDLMQATLRGLGIDTTLHLDGRSALAALPAEQPDAMVLDLMMPGFDGFAMLDALQRLPAAQRPPVLVWTSLVLDDEAYRRLTASALAIVSKGGGAIGEMLAQLQAQCRRLPPASADLDATEARP